MGIARRIRDNDTRTVDVRLSAIRPHVYKTRPWQLRVGRPSRRSGTQGSHLRSKPKAQHDKPNILFIMVQLTLNQPMSSANAWLRDRGYTGRIVFLTGHASTHPLVVEAQRIGDAEIFSNPVEPDRLRSIVKGERQ